MTDQITMANPVSALDTYLRSASQRDSFDMTEAPDLSQLEPYRVLHDAVAWLDEKIGQRWRRADAEALSHQEHHQRLARTAVASGAAAIVLAVLQLGLRSSWHGLTVAAATLEAIVIIAAILAVVVGTLARRNDNWLGCRHLAERLRMLKFQALGRRELWDGSRQEWQAWVEAELKALPDSVDLEAIEDWSSSDSAEPAPCVDPKIPDGDARALAAYYLHKRIRNQAAYFRNKGRKAARHWSVWMRHKRALLFIATIVCVVIHFAAELAAALTSAPGARHTFELISVWGVVLAAILPVIGLAVRAWSSTFEWSRKARTFKAKRRALLEIRRGLRDSTDNLPRALWHIQHCEHFLAQEHREWLRLLLDAEWFL